MTRLILSLGVLLSEGALFIICSKTKDDHSFIDKMGSKVKNVATHWGPMKCLWFWIYLITLYQHTQAIPVCDLGLIELMWIALYDQFVASNSVWISCRGWWILYRFCYRPCVFHVIVLDEIGNNPPEYMEVQILYSLCQDETTTRGCGSFVL